MGETVKRYLHIKCFWPKWLFNNALAKMRGILILPVLDVVFSKMRQPKFNKNICRHFARGENDAWDASKAINPENPIA